MTQKQLEQLCASWQKILRLQDWVVGVRFCKPYEFESGAGNLGETSINFPSKRAKIKILREDLRSDDSASTQATLLHELIHLHIEPLVIEEGAVRRNAIERAVESLATGFEVLAHATVQPTRSKPTRSKR